MAERDLVEFEIHPSDVGSRIDRLVRKLLPGVPLSRINRMLRRGEVTRSGEKATGSDRAEAGDVIAVTLDPDDAAELRARLAVGGGRAEPATPAPAIEVPVIYEDEHIVAFDKPPGVAAHPGSSHPLERTVLGALLSLAGEGTATFRPSLVGRLDRDTSGVQLAGRSPAGLRGLEATSRARGIRKTYLALVRGQTLPGSGRLDLPLRDRGSGRARMEVVEVMGDAEARRQCTVSETEAIGAVTDYRVLARGHGASLVEVRPVTGRRHQIRAHLAHAGSPVAGDVRYGDRRWNASLRSRAGLSRLFLHCAEVSFSHPVGGATSSGQRIRPSRATVEVSSPLPGELSAALTKLGIRVAGRHK